MKAKIIVTLYIKNVTGALYTVNYNENTLSVSVSVNAAWNSVVLTAGRNDCSEVAALTNEGRAFQARAAATGKARSPSEWSAPFVTSPQKIQITINNFMTPPGPFSHRRQSFIMTYFVHGQMLMPCKADDKIYARMHDSSTWILHLDVPSLGGEQHQLL